MKTIISNESTSLDDNSIDKLLEKISSNYFPNDFQELDEDQLNSERRTVLQNLDRDKLFEIARESHLSQPSEIWSAYRGDDTDLTETQSQVVYFVTQIRREKLQDETIEAYYRNQNGMEMDQNLEHRIYSHRKKINTKITSMSLFLAGFSLLLASSIFIKDFFRERPYVSTPDNSHKTLASEAILFSNLEMESTSDNEENLSSNICQNFFDKLGRNELEKYAYDVMSFPSNYDNIQKRELIDYLEGGCKEIRGKDMFLSAIKREID